MEGNVGADIMLSWNGLNTLLENSIISELRNRPGTNEAGSETEEEDSEVYGGRTPRSLHTAFPPGASAGRRVDACKLLPYGLISPLLDKKSLMPGGADLDAYIIGVILETRSTFSKSQYLHTQ